MTPIRELERQSIERFLQDNHLRLEGRVLDIGCGRQPYRHIVDGAGGEYIGYDRPNHPGSVVQAPVGEYWDLVDDVDTVIMTQVWQYIPPWVLLDMLTKLASGDWCLKQGGCLLATGPTNWPHIEPEDLHRLTTSGVRSLLTAARFHSIEIGPRYDIEYGGERWTCGWWAKAYS